MTFSLKLYPWLTVSSESESLPDMLQNNSLWRVLQPIDSWSRHQAQ